MQFDVVTQDFLSALDVVARVADNREPLAVLRNVLLEPQHDGGLLLTAINREVTVRTQIPARVTDASSRVTVPSTTLRDLVATLSDARTSISLSTNGAGIVLRSGRARATINGLPADEFPPVTDVSHVDVTLPAAELKRALQSVLPQAAQEMNRPVLTGICFEFGDGRVHLIGADGFRMGMSSVSADLKLKRTVVVPAKVLKEVSRILTDGDVGLTFSEDDGSITLFVRQTRFQIRLLEGRYPDVNALRKASLNPTYQIRVNRMDLLTDLKRALVYARDNHDMVRFASNIAEQQLVVSGQSGERGDSTASLPAQITSDQPDLEVSVNGIYARDVLGAIDAEQVVIETQGAASMIIFRPADEHLNDWFGVMPMGVK